MTYPTPEEIVQIAKECGITSGTARTTVGEIANYATNSQLQAFFLHGIEIGREMQREKDEELLLNRQATVSQFATLSDCAIYNSALRDAESAIRNNTGE